MITTRSHTEPAVDCSVLVPVLNEERYLADSVSAMQRQRFDGSMEFLFADGGSEDRTRQILEQIALTDRRIRIFDNPNRYASSALNVALAHARGRWVVRMDAHTRYPEDYVARAIARLQQGGTRWVSGPQAPQGDGPVSRAVALALGSRLGRGGSRKWGGRGVQEVTSTSSMPGCSEARGSARRSWNTGAGMSAPHPTRTRNWQPGSWLAVSD